MGIEKKKICLVGAGKTMQKHLDVFKNFKNIEFSGIYNRSKKKALFLKKKYKIKKIFNDITKMYKDTKSDYIIVVVSPEASFKILKKCIKYPWIIFTEKPLGCNYTEGKILINLVKKSKSNLFIGMNRRSYISTKNLMVNLKKQKSKKRFVEILDQQAPNEKKFNKKVIKNWHFANSIHLIDYIPQICRGNIKEFKRKIFKLGGKKKYLECKIKYTSGDECFYKALWYIEGKWHVKVTLKNKVFILKPLEKFKVGKPNKSNFYLLKRNYSIDKKFKPGFFNQAKNLLNKKKIKNLVNVIEYQKTNNLIKKIYE